MTNNEIISLAEETANKLKELLETLPYSANIITELHANENAHSRILRLLLEYNRNGKFPIFESFVKYINSQFSNKINIRINEPRFTNEEERIDVLIEDSNKYAIIIENKVCGAGDQDKQIERYIKKCIEHGIDSKTIYVLYLTQDGYKEVEDYSFTDIAQEKLDYSEESNGRFFPINYKDHILPWLEKEVLPNTPFKEKILISALEQYIDYIKEMLCLRPEDEEINKQMEIFVMEKLEELNIKSFSELKKTYSELQELNNFLNKIKDERINRIGNEKILLPLKAILNDVKSVEGNFWDGYLDIYITDNRLKQSYFYITNEEKYNKPLYYGIGQNDVNNNPLPEETRNKVYEKMSKFGFSQTFYSPCWKHVEPIYQIPNMDFWEKVDSGEIKPAEYFAQCYHEVIDKLQDVAL